jgi:hypothetical protein
MSLLHVCLQLACCSVCHKVSLFIVCGAMLLLQHDYTFDEVSAKSAAGAKLSRLVRLRPLINLLTSTGVNSSRGLLLVMLVSTTDTAGLARAGCGQRALSCTSGVWHIMSLGVIPQPGAIQSNLGQHLVNASH